MRGGGGGGVRPELAHGPCARTLIGPPGPFNRTAPLSLSTGALGRRSEIVAGCDQRPPDLPTYARFGKCCEERLYLQTDNRRTTKGKMPLPVLLIVLILLF